MLTTLPLTARGGINTTFRPTPCIVNPNSAIPCTPSTLPPLLKEFEYLLLVEDGGRTSYHKVIQRETDTPWIPMRVIQNVFVVVHNFWAVRLVSPVVALASLFHAQCPMICLVWRMGLIIDMMGVTAG